jgi:chitin disaccharide deacetylase
MKRRIWLCADDYGISPGVNRAIRDLIERGRLNATSVMVVGAAISRAEADALKASVSASPRCAIGLHATLTAPFRPLTMHFRPLEGEMFLSFAKLFRRGFAGRLDGEIISTEVKEQIAAFADLFGRVPDFVDAHQHVQLFPGIQNPFLNAVKEAVPTAWVRQCGRNRPLLHRLNSMKALVLDLLSAQFRARASHMGLAFNASFSGAYDFSQEPDFAALMPQFLEEISERGVVMCHPGLVDDVLISLDPFTFQREREYAFLGGEQFLAQMERSQVTLG